MDTTFATFGHFSIQSSSIYQNYGLCWCDSKCSNPKSWSYLEGHTLNVDQQVDVTWHAFPGADIGDVPVTSVPRRTHAAGDSDPTTKITVRFESPPFSAVNYQAPTGWQAKIVSAKFGCDVDQDAEFFCHNNGSDDVYQTECSNVVSSGVTPQLPDSLTVTWTMGGADGLPLADVGDYLV